MEEDPWENISDFSQLQGLMILFLNGKLTYNPWHATEVDPETVPLLEDLIKLNDLGCVSIEGQPGECDEDVIQRAYLDGFVQNNIDIDNLFNLCEQNEIFCVVTDYNNQTFYRSDNYNTSIYNLTIEYDKYDPLFHSDNQLYHLLYRQRVNITDETIQHYKTFVNEYFDNEQDRQQLLRFISKIEVGLKYNMIDERELLNFKRYITRNVVYPLFNMRQDSLGDEVRRVPRIHTLRNDNLNNKLIYTHYPNLTDFITQNCYAVSFIKLKQCETDLVELLIEIFEQL